MPANPNSTPATTRNGQSPRRTSAKPLSGNSQTLPHRSALGSSGRSSRATTVAIASSSSATDQNRSSSGNSKHKTEEEKLNGSGALGTPEAPPQDETGRFLISPPGKGDLVLDVHRSADDPSSESFTYVVSSASVATHSEYFARLLDPDKFGEGTRVAAQRKSLEEQYGGSNTGSGVPTADLPTIMVHDVGGISPKVTSIAGLMADFFAMLHGRPLLSSKKPPLTNIANLVIVADRFDALDWMAQYMREHRYLAVFEGRFSKERLAAQSPGEEKARIGLFVGLMLGRENWVAELSRYLIVLGSKVWKEDVIGGGEGKKGMKAPEKAGMEEMWWELPMGIEDELYARREAVLSTILSIPSHFLLRFSSPSGDLQCKLGYDNSSQCDSFQLGEMVKFFTRMGILDITSLFGVVSAESESKAISPRPSILERNLLDLLKGLRQCPNYQIDRNHSHCGLRDPLIPLVDLLEMVLHSVKWLGICLDCWCERRKEYAWTDAKGPLVWNRRMLFTGRRKEFLFSEPGGKSGLNVACSSVKEHLPPRDMFLAREKDWSFRE